MKNRLFRIINISRAIHKPDGLQKGEYGKKFAKRAKTLIESTMRRMGNEASETKEMAHSFFKLLSHKLRLDERNDPPTEEEVLEAIEQLKDVGRFSVFTTAVILPGGAVSLMGLELLARRFGIQFTFIPSSFRKNAEWSHPDGHRRKKKSNLNKKSRDISDVNPI